MNDRYYLLIQAYEQRDTFVLYSLAAAVAVLVGLYAFSRWPDPLRKIAQPLAMLIVAIVYAAAILAKV